MSKPFLIIQGQKQVEKITSERRPWKVGGALRDKRNDYKRNPKHKGREW
jgi:hypothetical protein